MKKNIAILLPVIMIILEITPYGAVLNFAPSSTVAVRETYSYFSLKPLGYANFGPFLTAILSCIMLVISFFYFVKKSEKLSKMLFMISSITLMTSLMPLIFGIESYSIVGALISAIIILELWISKNLM